MRPLLFALLVGTPLLAAAPAAAQVGTLRPVDEGAADPSFLTFRGRLLGALAARDTAAVLAAFAPDARLSFGDDPGGPDGVRRMWLGRGRGARSLWAALARVVAMGSVRDEANQFVSAPYVYNVWPEGVDPFAHGAVVGESVRVRASPSREAEVLTSLSYAIVPLQGEAPDGWARITLGDGRAGFVSREYLWSPVDYRAGFEKQAGGWRIVFFLSGD